MDTAVLRRLQLAAWLAMSWASLGLAAAPVKLNGMLAPMGDVSAGFEFSPDGRRVVYLADQDANDVFELYSVESAGGAPAKLNGNLVGGGDVSSWRVGPDGGHVIYWADQDIDGRTEIYCVAITGGQPLKLNAPLVPGGKVGPAMFSPDASRVVYVANQETNHLFELFDELFSVPSSGGTAQKLNAPLPPGGDVGLALLSPDGSHVLYVADQDVDTVDEVYIVPATGGTPTRLNGQLVAGGRVMSQGLQFSPDGSRVLYVANQESPGTMELFSVPSAGGAAVKLSGPLVPGGNVLSSGLRFSPDGARVLYLADQERDNVFELYSVPSGGGTPIKLNSTPVDGGRVLESPLAFSPDGGRVLYVADQDVNDVFELFSAATSGGNLVKLNAALVAGGDVRTATFSPAGGRVLYRADQDLDEMIELYSVAGSGGVPVRLNGPLVPGGNVVDGRFAPDGRHVVYLADQDMNDVFELFLVPGSGGTPMKLNGPLVAGGDVTHWQISPDGRRLVYRADQDMDEVFELYAVELFVGVPGDYNGNGVVDAADYTVWRNSLGQTGAGLSADGSGPTLGVPDGVVDQLDYDFWKQQFGATAGGGLGGQTTVPEPSSVLLSLWAGGGCCMLCSRRRGRTRTAATTRISPADRRPPGRAGTCLPVT